MTEWTNDDDFWLRALWDANHSTIEIGRRINRSKNAICGRAHRLGLPERPSPIIRDGRQQADGRPSIARVRGPTLPPLRSAVGDPQETLVLVSPPVIRGAWRTMERVAFIQAWWPSYVPSYLIIDRLRAMPGPAWTEDSRIGIWAATEGLKRPPDIRSNHGTGATAARDFRAAMAELPIAATVPEPPAVRSAPIVARPAVPRSPALLADKHEWRVRGEVAAALARRVVTPVIPPAVKAPTGRVIPCCWPTNDGWPWMFCEVPSDPGRPYCTSHVSAAYVRIRDRRDDMAQAAD